MQEQKDRPNATSTFYYESVGRKRKQTLLTCSHQAIIDVFPSQGSIKQGPNKSHRHSFHSPTLTNCTDFSTPLNYIVLVFGDISIHREFNITELSNSKRGHND